MFPSIEVNQIILNFSTLSSMDRIQIEYLDK